MTHPDQSEAPKRSYGRLRRPVGIGLLILAGIGGLLPILQGWVFFVAAIGVLGKDDPIIQWCFRMMERGRPILNRFGIWKKKPGEEEPAKDAPGEPRP